MTLPAAVVESLRARIVRCLDETLTAEERDDARVRLVGYLSHYLNGPAR